MSCAPFEAEVVEEFAGRLTASRRTALRVHVRSCARCRAQWDRAALAEQRALGEARLERTWSFLAAQDVAQPSEAAVPERLGWRLPLAAALVTSLVAGLAAVGWWALERPTAPGTTTGTEAWQVRGGGEDRAAASLRLLRIQRRPDGVAVSDLGSSPHVRVGESVLPLVSNLTEAPRWVSLWLTIEGEPSPRALGVPVALEAGQEDLRLPLLLVEAAWATHSVTIWGVFEPVPTPQTNDGLARGDREGVSMRKLAVTVSPSDQTP
jgi:hypothetical protein